MNFLVISDSHRNINNISKAKERCPQVDAILFLGDGTEDFCDTSSYYGTPLYCVRGNCDFDDESIPYELMLHFDEYAIMMMHGHLHATKVSYEKAAAYAAQKGADILLFGHTHLPTEKYLPKGTLIGGVTLEKPLYVFNPGSIGRICEGFSSCYFGTMRTTPKGVIFGHGEI